VSTPPPRVPPSAFTVTVITAVPRGCRVGGSKRPEAGPREIVAVGWGDGRRVRNERGIADVA